MNHRHFIFIGLAAVSLTAVLLIPTLPALAIVPLNLPSNLTNASPTPDDSFAGATTDPNASPIAVPGDFTATYKISKVNGVNQAVISWVTYPGATNYRIYKTVDPEHPVDVTADKISLDISDGSLFGVPGGADKYTVDAVVETPATDQTQPPTVQVLASASAKNTDVARATTEFGPIANIGEFAQRLMKYALPVGVVLTILMIMYAGVTFMLSQGSPDKLKDARDIIEGALIGLTILILARVLVDFLFLKPISDATDLLPTTTSEKITQTTTITSPSPGAPTDTAPAAAAGKPPVATGSVGAAIFGKIFQPITKAQANIAGFNTPRDPDTIGSNKRCHRGADFSGLASIKFPFAVQVLAKGTETSLESTASASQAKQIQLLIDNKFKALGTPVSPGGGIVVLYVPDLDVTLIFRHQQIKQITKTSYAAGELILAPAPVNTSSYAALALSGYSTTGAHFHFEVIPGKFTDAKRFTLWQEALYEYSVSLNAVGSNGQAQINPYVLLNKPLAQAKAEAHQTAKQLKGNNGEEILGKAYPACSPDGLAAVLKKT